MSSSDSIFFVPTPDENKIKQVKELETLITE